MSLKPVANKKLLGGEFHCERRTVQRGKHQILRDSLVYSLQTSTSVKDMLKVILKKLGVNLFRFRLQNLLAQSGM